MYQCKACQAEYYPKINPHTGEDEELCDRCLMIALYAANDIEDEDSDDPSLAVDYLEFESECRKFDD